MNKRAIVVSTANYVRSTMPKEGTGHDWWHIYRVWRTALSIAKREKGSDLFVVQLGALLHDIADWKFHGGDTKIGGNVARKWLEKAGVDKDNTDKVCDIVENISFKGAGVRDAMNSKEGKIVQDADRLDAIGAIGIARAFAYGGHADRPIHDPDAKPHRHSSFSAYKASNSTTINHFYEKLLLLKGRMNTREGRRLAGQRDAFLRAYLNRFFREWEGKE
jgi:uncharacterized protein